MLDIWHISNIMLVTRQPSFHDWNLAWMNVLTRTLRCCMSARKWVHSDFMDMLVNTITKQGTKSEFHKQIKDVIHLYIYRFHLISISKEAQLASFLDLRVKTIIKKKEEIFGFFPPFSTWSSNWFMDIDLPWTIGGWLIAVIFLEIILISWHQHDLHQIKLVFLFSSLGCSWLLQYSSSAVSSFRSCSHRRYHPLRQWEEKP